MRSVNRNNILTAILISIVVFASCKSGGVPRPRGVLRIDVPSEHLYVPTDSTMSLIFEYAAIATLSPAVNKQGEQWYNIDYPQWNGRIYLSYFELNDSNLLPLTEDARKFVYKHAVMASSIEESVFSFPDRHVHGVLYDIGGDAASAVQFYATDSTNNFLRASLYFNAPPARDSLNPVIEYVREDMLHLISTLTWQNIHHADTVQIEQ
jgi:gliding motility-associated lipoprotein GldD